jgi:peptidoglycan hydrolase-like protein with peptidoglycan-binding domain
MHGRQTPTDPNTRSHHEIRSQWDWRVVAAAVAVAAAVGAGVVLTTDHGSTGVPAAVAADAAAAVDVAADVPAEIVPAADIVAQPSVELDGCTVTVTTVRLDDSGPSVECVQKALTAAGSYTGAISGTFDAATETAVRAFQASQDLEDDGIVGGKTASTLGIWPGDESFVVHTPPPAPGATDSWGAALSSVATTGDAAPPMPANTGQGTGKRVVYDRAGQRVWAVDDQERVVRSYLVTGSQYHNEIPGRHEVYSRSEVSTAWNGQAYLPLMIRWLDTERGAIGFHGIPTHISDGSAYQTDAELGQKLSGGCQRQSNLDAAFLWQFAQIGTPVYVT